MPQPEKAARRDDLQQRLPGIRLRTLWNHFRVTLEDNGGVSGQALLDTPPANGGVVFLTFGTLHKHFQTSLR